MLYFKDYQNNIFAFDRVEEKENLNPTLEPIAEGEVADILLNILPNISAADVKTEASRRIRESGHDWMAIRKVSTGEDIPQNILDYAAAVREASNLLEQSPPENFRDNQYWPELPA